MCTERTFHPLARSLARQAGVTLVELIVALTLATVVMGSIWSAWTLLSTRSADPLVARQQLAVAQSLLREIELQPLPGTAVAAATPGRTGYASISDYDGLVMSGISDIEGQVVPGLQSYGASISVQPQAFNGVAASQGWWIQVSVTGPDSRALLLGAWRARR